MLKILMLTHQITKNFKGVIAFLVGKTKSHKPYGRQFGLPKLKVHFNWSIKIKSSFSFDPKYHFWNFNLKMHLCKYESSSLIRLLNAALFI
jgi:hypothetical protein